MKDFSNYVVFKVFNKTQMMLDVLNSRMLSNNEEIKMAPHTLQQRVQFVVLFQENGYLPMNIYSKSLQDIAANNALSVNNNKRILDIF